MRSELASILSLSASALGVSPPRIEFDTSGGDGFVATFPNRERADRVIEKAVHLVIGSESLPPTGSTADHGFSEILRDENRRIRGAGSGTILPEDVRDVFESLCVLSLGSGFYLF